MIHQINKLNDPPTTFEFTTYSCLCFFTDKLYNSMGLLADEDYNGTEKSQEYDQYIKLCKYFKFYIIENLPKIFNLTPIVDNNIILIN